MTQSEIEAGVPIADTGAQNRKKALRKKLFVALLAGVTICGAGYYAYDYFIGSRYVTTDNAYVGAETAHVTPLVGGPVEEVRVSDTDMVKAGEVLVVLDATDARLALAQAEAALGQAERRVRTYFANDEGLSAQVTARGADQARAAADVASAKSALDRARVDFSRRQALAASGSVSGDELTATENAFRQASAAYDAALAAQAQAAANREAPLDGVIVQRAVHVGQRVQSGATLMSIVPIGEAYVDANFKEMQLTRVKEGQEVELTSDLYGSDVVFRGRVVGLSGGTGSAFAL